MKKLAIAFVVLFVLSIAGSVFAAESPFSDVPADHWAYDAVKQLSAAGIVDGYKDGKSSITRFEMAIITAKAMAKLDKVNGNQKESIRKMAAEFDPEIRMINEIRMLDNNRVAPVENKAPAGNKNGLRITGEVLESYERAKNYNSEFYTRLRIKLYEPLTDNLAFIGRIQGESSGTQTILNVTDAFLAGKAFGLNTFALGRIPFVLGQGLAGDSEYVGTNRGGIDGIVLGTGNKLKFVYAAGKVGFSDVNTPPSVKVPFTIPGRMDMQGFNIGYTVNDRLALSASRSMDKDRYMYETNSAGINYKALPNVTIIGEYGENESYLSKLFNKNDSAKGWFAKAKYRGANGRNENSYGMWVSYRNMDPAFDLWTLGNAGHSRVPHALWTGAGINGATETSNVKGFEYGFEQTLFKNAIMSVQYFDFQAKTSEKSAESYMVSLNYQF